MPECRPGRKMKEYAEFDAYDYIMAAGDERAEMDGEFLPLEGLELAGMRITDADGAGIVK